MPGYRPHIIGGAVLAAGALFAAQTLRVHAPGLPTQAAQLAVATAFALAPDVDTHSRGRSWFYGLLVLADAALIVTRHYQWAALLGLLAMLPAIDGHRGWTHTWWAMLLVPLPLLLAPVLLYGWAWQTAAPWYLSAVLGYFSHLLLDRQF